MIGGGRHGGGIWCCHVIPQLASKTERSEGTRGLDGLRAGCGYWVGMGSLNQCCQETATMAACLPVKRPGGRCFDFWRLLHAYYETCSIALALGRSEGRHGSRTHPRRGAQGDSRGQEGSIP